MTNTWFEDYYKVTEGFTYEQHGALGRLFHAANYEGRLQGMDTNHEAPEYRVGDTPMDSGPLGGSYE